jgi:hypothetical protein
MRVIFTELSERDHDVMSAMLEAAAERAREPGAEHHYHWGSEPRWHGGPVCYVLTITNSRQLQSQSSQQPDTQSQSHEEIQ